MRSTPGSASCPCWRSRWTRDCSTATTAPSSNGSRDGCEDGEFDDGSAPARLHGDLWSGNIAWTPQGAVLIDPAAHGGHRETDLAMLALFGCPHWDFVVGGYLGQHRLDSQWQERVALHQLHPLLVHAVLFGADYPHRALELARRYR